MSEPLNKVSTLAVTQRRLEAFVANPTTPSLLSIPQEVFFRGVLLGIQAARRGEGLSLTDIDRIFSNHISEWVGRHKIDSEGLQ